MASQAVRLWLYKDNDRFEHVGDPEIVLRAQRLTNPWLCRACFPCFRDPRFVVMTEEEQEALDDGARFDLGRACVGGGELRENSEEGGAKTGGQKDWGAGEYLSLRWEVSGLTERWKEREGGAENEGGDCAAKYVGAHSAVALLH
eukprot:2448082-Pleurochrysis_carterae.AAC.2